MKSYVIAVGCFILAVGVFPHIAQSQESTARFEEPGTFGTDTGSYDLKVDTRKTRQSEDAVTIKADHDGFQVIQGDPDTQYTIDETAGKSEKVGGAWVHKLVATVDKLAGIVHYRVSGTYGSEGGQSGGGGQGGAGGVARWDADYRSMWLYLKEEREDQVERVVHDATNATDDTPSLWVGAKHSAGTSGTQFGVSCYSRPLTFYLSAGEQGGFLGRFDWTYDLGGVSVSGWWSDEAYTRTVQAGFPVDSDCSVEVTRRDDPDFKRFIYVKPIAITLAADTDRDNSIDDFDQRDKDAWTMERGAIILANQDDDASDSEPDSLNNVVDGQNDLADIAQLWIAKAGQSDLPEGLTLTLSLEQPDSEHEAFQGISAEERVRVFWPTVADGSSLVLTNTAAGVVGPGDPDDPNVPASAEHEWSKTAQEDQLGFFGGSGILKAGIEGIEMGAEIDVVLTVTLDDVELGTDRVRIKVAPWMMPSHRDQVQQVYVTTATPIEIRRGLATALGIQNYPQTDPDPLPAEGFDNGILRTIVSNDIWIQDQMLVGCYSAPHGWHNAIINSPRNRGAGLHNRVTNLRTPGISVFRPALPRTPSSTFDSFGNVDAFPPGDDDRGGVYYGYTTTSTHPDAPIHEDLREFFALHAGVGPQADPTTLDSTWLAVGHVDEFMAVQMTGNGNVRVIVASTALAIALFEDDPDAVLDGSWLSESTNGDMTAQEVLDEWQEYNEDIEGTLDDIADFLENEMGFEVVRVPGYFAEVEVELNVTRAVSLLPNMVNMLNVNGTLITLDPMWEPFRNAFEDELGALGNGWIEGLEVHHGDGGIHCATNTRREPQNELKHWWED